MHVSGLVITLGGEREQAAEALRQLAAFPGLTLGERVERRVAAALEAADAAAGAAAFERLAAAFGVVHVDVAFAQVAPHDGAEDFA